MEESKLKNMVVLKNLPSNLIEEAIIVLKPNKNARKLEKIDNDKINKVEKSKNVIEKDFVVKEAEFVITSYISNVEKNVKKKKKLKQNRVKNIIG